MAAPTIPGVAVNSSISAGNTSQIVVRGLAASQHRQHTGPDCAGCLVHWVMLASAWCLQLAWQTQASKPCPTQHDVLHSGQ